MNLFFINTLTNKEGFLDNIPRKPWLAGVLTIFSLGLGHLYIGEAKKGIMLFFIAQVLFVIGFLSFFYAPIGPMIFISLGVVFVIFCILDAVKLSKCEIGDAPQIYSFNLIGSMLWGRYAKKSKDRRTRCIASYHGQRDRA